MTVELTLALGAWFFAGIMSAHVIKLWSRLASLEDWRRTMQPLLDRLVKESERTYALTVEMHEDTVRRAAEGEEIMRRVREGLLS